ncbi:hypothetical protein ANCCEY_08502 [Ancylostoma ceylanicum]|uniref:Uncharacterized protein n=1 Tax=Ancylostoma ceylanicum TaxID=53326 RepID=A0A0D6LK03_9BILA|nr:hypothetical protein ANCCEY_08502 [Ancylostoma ceylanicum]
MDSDDAGGPSYQTSLLSPAATCSMQRLFDTQLRLECYRQRRYGIQGSISASEQKSASTNTVGLPGICVADIGSHCYSILIEVVVSEPSNTPTAPPAKERDISNAGWVPMEGGNFDRRKFCIMLFVLVMLGMVLYLGTVFFHYHAKLVRFAYHEGVDHGKMAAKYQSFDMQKAPVKAEMKAERNLTAIIDEICKRCFAKQLYDNAVSSPINFMNILTGSPKNDKKSAYICCGLLCSHEPHLHELYAVVDNVDEH